MATIVTPDGSHVCVDEFGAPIENRTEASAEILTLRSALQAAEKGKAEAEANYRFMVERAADEKLDGYRELGARAAAAENERDTLRARVQELEKALGEAVSGDKPEVEPELVAAKPRIPVPLAALPDYAKPACGTCGGSKRVHVSRFDSAAGLQGYDAPCPACSGTAKEG